MKIWGTLLEKFPNASSRADAGEQHPRVVQPREELREHRDLGAPAEGAARASAGAKQQERLDTLIVQAVFKQGEQKAAAGDHAAAAAAYLRAAKEFPKDPRAAQACVNAELEAKKAGDVDDAARRRRTLATGAAYRDRPESPDGRVDGGDDAPGDGPLRRGGRRSTRR